jgi:hypothetical protein
MIDAARQVSSGQLRGPLALVSGQRPNPNRPLRPRGARAALLVFDMCFHSLCKRCWHAGKTAGFAGVKAAHRAESTPKPEIVAVKHRDIALGGAGNLPKFSFPSTVSVYGFR